MLSRLARFLRGFVVGGAVMALAAFVLAPVWAWPLTTIVGLLAVSWLASIIAARLAWFDD